MKPETFNILCKPGTHEPSCLTPVSGPNGSAQEVLAGVHSDEDFRSATASLFYTISRKSLDSTSSIKGSTTGLQEVTMAQSSCLHRGEAHFRGEYLWELSVNESLRLLCN
jgi:hypothetical protein